jgi:hypothetical protein
MLKIFEDGENRFRLERDDGELVGWIRGQAICLQGYESESVAIRAALVARQALDNVVSNYLGGRRPKPPDPGAVRLVHDGAYEWVSEGGLLPIARLLRPAADRRDARGFAIEFLLPSYIVDGIAVNAAQTMFGAVERALKPDPPGRKLVSYAP